MCGISIYYAMTSETAIGFLRVNNRLKYLSSNMSGARSSVCLIEDLALLLHVDIDVGANSPCLV